MRLSDEYGELIIVLCSYRGWLPHWVHFDRCTSGVLSHVDLQECLQEGTTVHQETEEKDCEV